MANAKFQQQNQNAKFQKLYLQTKNDKQEINSNQLEIFRDYKEVLIRKNDSKQKLKCKMILKIMKNIKYFLLLYIFKLNLHIIQQTQDNQIFNLIEQFQQNLRIFKYAEGQISGNYPFYYKPYYYAYADLAPSSTNNKFNFNKFVSLCTAANIVQNGGDCPLMSISVSAGNVLITYPQPNKLCQISFTCTSPSSATQNFVISSFPYGCSSNSAAQTIYYTALNIPDQTFIQNQVVSFLVPLSTYWTFDTSTCFPSSDILSSCTLTRQRDGNNFRNLVTSFNKLRFTLSTTTGLAPDQYFIWCDTSLSCPNCYYLYSNQFSIEVIACTPSISGISTSYSRVVKSSSLPYTMIPTGYASRTNSSLCSLSLALYYSNGTLYTATSPISFDSTTGVLTITSESLFSLNLYIKATSIYSTSNNSVQQAFTVAQTCSGYCTPSITGIVSSSYVMGVLSAGGQSVLSNYASTTNSVDCIMTYSMQYASNNSTYSWTDLSILSTTGQISIQSNNIFTSLQLKVTVTSTFASIPCSGTVQSIAFTVSQTCNGYCTPSITGITSTSYSVVALTSGGQSVLSIYASTTNSANCIKTYSMQYASNNSTYSGTDLSISSTSGMIQTLSNNIFVSAPLKITVTSTNALIPCSGTVQSSTFTISQDCGYCTSSITGGITQSAYIQELQNQGLIVIQPSATTTNAGNCIISFNLIQYSNGLAYSGSDLSISSNSGSLIITSSNLFTSVQLQISVTSSYAAAGCYWTTLSNPFTVTQICGSYCSPTFSSIQSSLYRFTIKSIGQTILSPSVASTNPLNCILTYSLQNQIDNSSYAGNEIQINSQNGSIINLSNKYFITNKLVITVTSTYSLIPCSTTIQSTPFQIEGINKCYEKISPPLNFIYLNEYQIDGQQPIFWYHNFTSNNTNCPILYHQIVYNESNNQVPQGLIQTQNLNDRFQIQVDKNYINVVATYHFQIKVNTTSGLTLYQSALIKMVGNCSNDEIKLNQSLGNPMKIRRYAYIASNFDISKVFYNIYSKDCPLSYYIDNVYDQLGQIIQIQNYSNLFFAQSNGLFVMKAQKQIIYENYSISIKTSNSKIQSSQAFTIYASIFNFAIKYQTPKAPQQSEKSKCQHHNLHESKQTPSTKFVQISDYLINDQGIVTLKFNNDLIVPDFIRYALNNKNKKIDIQQIDSQMKAIYKISYTDVVTLKNIIYFEVSSKSMIEQENLQFQIDLLNWTSKNISIQIKFNNPSLVSAGEQYDQITIMILNGSNFISNKTKLQLNECLNYTLEIPPLIGSQISGRAQQIAAAVSSSSQVIVIAHSILQLFLKKSLSPNQKLLLNLQMQVALPIFSISLPSAASFYIKYVKQTIEFSLFKPETLSSIFGYNVTIQDLLKIDLVKESDLPGNLKRSGVTSPSLLCDVIQILFQVGIALTLGIIFTVVLFIFYSLEEMKVKIKSSYQKMKFNGLIRIITIGFLKQSLSFSTVLIYNRNLNWKFMKSNNSKQSKIIQLAQLFFTALYLIGVPLAIFVKLKINKISLKEKSFVKNFSKEYGNFIEGMKIRKDLIVLVSPLLLLNRLVFAMTPFFIWKNPSLQLVFLIVETHLYVMFLSSLNINNYWLDYYQDMFNEFMLLLMYTLMLFFVDGGLIHGTLNDLPIQSKIFAMQAASYAFTSIGILIILVNFALLFNGLIKTACLLAKKYYNLHAPKEKQQLKNQNQKQLKKKDFILKIKEEIKNKEVPKRKQQVNKKQVKNEVKIKEKQTSKNTNKVQFIFDEDIASLYKKNKIGLDKKQIQLYSLKEKSQNNQETKGNINNQIQKTVSDKKIWNSLDDLQRQFFQICMEHKNLFGVNMSEFYLIKDKNINRWSSSVAPNNILNVQELAYNHRDTTQQLNDKYSKVFQILENNVNLLDIEEYKDFKSQKDQCQKQLQFLRDKAIRDLKSKKY